MSRSRIAVALAALLSLSLLGCTNETTPEGHEGYIQHIPLVMGNAYFVGYQTGPTSTGMVWRQRVTNVDMRPKNYTESFHILSRDNLNIGFQAHVRISLRPGSVRQVVERYGAGLNTGPPVNRGDRSAPRQRLSSWYVRNVQQPYRPAVRDVVHTHNAYDIQGRTQEIARAIMGRLQRQYASTPIRFESISIGNLTYPAEINREIQRKLAAEQDLERMTREMEIARQQAQIAITTARGRAAAQRVVNQTLTPLYVQHEMLEQFRRLSRSRRVTMVIMPTGENSSSPVMINLPRTSTAAPAPARSR